MAIPAQSDVVPNQVVEQLTDLDTRLRAMEIDVAVIKSNYATKEDIAKLDIKMQGAIGGVDAKVDAKTSQLEIKIAQMEIRLIRWFVGTAITLSGVVGAIAFAAAKYIH
ncbi:hypothetical protein [Duganella sp. BuS-21]|uniref:hypothetical protein n=1 Tax=Duganella sp. BuS-21 TaxID=2943848 RepID=UPI0035A6FDE7